MRFVVKVTGYDGSRERVINEEDLLGVITGRLTSYTMLLDPADPLSLQVTISRTGDGE